MNVLTDSHRNGNSVVPLEEIIYLEEKFNRLTFTFRPRCSRELRTEVIDILRLNGWSNEVKISTESDITITSIKNDIGLCLQTGNISRVYADLLKLQTLFLDGKIYSAIYITPTKEAALKMGDNIANLERITQELHIFNYVITIPIIIIGIEGEK
ncbi:hypothetical protein WH51_13375 [Bacilli bacterium VT-13-104]|nr:hypothetical protein WH51_13375 [Bacilli bacterium VT-13-104]